LTGRKKLPDTEELIAILQRNKWTYEQAAQHYGVTRPAISGAINRYRLHVAGLEGHQRLLPWKVRDEHYRENSIVHNAVMAYAKWQRGQPLSERELANAKKLIEIARTKEAVLIYRQDAGYGWRNRRPEDDPESILAAS